VKPKANKLMVKTLEEIPALAKLKNEIAAVQSAEEEVKEV